MTPKRWVIAILAGVAVVVIASAVAYHLGALHALNTDAARSDPKCADFHDAPSHVGEQTCIAGRVLRVFTSRSGSTFLDFCEDYHNCPFTSVIFSSNRSRFGNLATLQGQRIEITGDVTSYRGRAEIVIRRPDQLHTVE